MRKEFPSILEVDGLRDDARKDMQLSRGIRFGSTELSHLGNVVFDTVNVLVDGFWKFIKDTATFVKKSPPRKKNFLKNAIFVTLLQDKTFDKLF